MIIRRCIHCGSKIEARNQREFEEKYNNHVRDDHGQPSNIGEVRP